MNTRNPQASEVALAYHERTKHNLHRYSAGPETLDWTAQPNPFREFSGSPRVTLPLSADALTAYFAQLYASPGTLAPQPLNLHSLGALLELSFGLSAWKEYGPGRSRPSLGFATLVHPVRHRWALRCNPSSGNLHPTECYVLCREVSGLSDGIYHYNCRDHALEQRFRAPRLTQPGHHSGVWIALSSVHWREAWKYGERAFRYCQLDVGHALGAVRYATAALGWQSHLENRGSQALAHTLGLDRASDFLDAEHEEPDLLLACVAQPGLTAHTERPESWDAADSEWHGRANVLDPHPMYSWPVIDQVAAATVAADMPGDTVSAAYSAVLEHPCSISATRIIKQRRSAQRFDGKYQMAAADFYRMLDRLLPRAILPWDVWHFSPRVHPALFIHRVEGIEPGLYALPRHTHAKTAMQQAMNRAFVWQREARCPEHIPLYQLAATDCANLARTLHCHQAIAATGCFAMGMLAEFDAIVRDVPWRYRQLHWEAGLLGHVLYLEAEATGLRGTGIGCFFDDAFHELLGLSDTRFQSLYHFTVGRALLDERITTLPPYPRTTTPATEDFT